MKSLYLLLLTLLLNSYLFAQTTTIPVDTFDIIYTMIDEVDTVRYVEDVQHLEDYGTRDCFTTEAVQAQNWFKDEFELLGLTVELQSFQVYSNDVSDNVIAVMPGTVAPDEYVVIGGHYDSFTGSGPAPGADDNASGSAGVLEIAKILSQYEFEKTIVFCAFSGEEYGLYGSEAYASRCNQENKIILGYVNLDMIGYHNPGDELHCDVLAPASALELVVFYKAIAGIYLPDFPIYDGVMDYGDSDHTSFNDEGYLGIFPFEDDENYSPYIHTDNDIIGSSLNSLLLAQKLMQAGLATVATLAVPVQTVGMDMPAADLKMQLYPNPASDMVKLEWEHNTSAQFEILSSTGAVVESGSFNQSASIDISQYPSGYYLVRVFADENQTTRSFFKL